MADYEMKRSANIGSSSLILIFIVLCLATFGLLSVGNSRREGLLSEKNAAAVQEYYRADRQGVEFLSRVDRALEDSGEKNADAAKEQVLHALGEFYQSDRDLFCTDVAMDAGQALRVELQTDWEKKSCRVVTWKVYQREEYEIDQSIPVWTGGEQSAEGRGE